MTTEEARLTWSAAEAEHHRTYIVQTIALLALYRAELAYLEAGGSCVFQPAHVRIYALRKLVDEWSRVVEKGESPETVWPEHARAEVRTP